uniref:Uncharacterized protein n=1 Tax=Anguilla anguilla TaxID=7936 RepID=A0A0E9Q7X3_ANGAN
MYQNRLQSQNFTEFEKSRFRKKSSSVFCSSHLDSTMCMIFQLGGRTN